MMLMRGMIGGVVMGDEELHTGTCTGCGRLRLISHRLCRECRTIANLTDAQITILETAGGRVTDTGRIRYPDGSIRTWNEEEGDWVRWFL